jgi:hypothetical protein
MGRIWTWPRKDLSKFVYQEIADELNHDFHTVLHADATAVGISIVPVCPLDLRRLAANIEASRVLAKRPKMTVTVTDCGIICIR